MLFLRELQMIMHSYVLQLHTCTFLLFLGHICHTTSHAGFQALVCTESACVHAISVVHTFTSVHHQQVENQVSKEAVLLQKFLTMLYEHTSLQKKKNCHLYRVQGRHNHTHTHTKKCHYDEVSRSCTRTLIVNKYMHDVHYTLT